MNFATATFFCFLPIVFALYWAIRRRSFQNGLLVIASYVFYGWWDYRFCALMLASSLIDYFVGLRLARAESKLARRCLLLVSLVANLGMLGVFKYFDFFGENLRILLSSVGWHVSDLTLNLILPVGISFYTFQTLSYTIDIYRRQLKPTRNIIDYLAFVSFFPQLVAGPIERASRLLPQFEQPRGFDLQAARDGCRLILWGLFKKLAIADRLSIVVNEHFSDPSMANGSQLALATLFFAFQIYCDFSAYSDIAVGTARLFNIRLMRNFAYPYFSQNLAEFWRRWHISLSTWFRDYVFIPLGGSRTGRLRRCVNILITFLVSGLWHGAAWRFIFWGGVHGAAVSSAALTNSAGNKKRQEDTAGGPHFIPRPITAIKILATFAVVCLAWIFFRAESIGEAFLIQQKIALSIADWSLFAPSYQEIMSNRVLRRTVTILLVFVAIEWIGRRSECPLHMRRQPVAVRWAAYTALIWITVDSIPQTGGQDFIYFEF